MVVTHLGTGPAQVTFDKVSPEQLLFDPNNPRFGGEARTKSQEQILEMLEGEPHLALLLVDSLLENGFIEYEPLVVRRQSENYVVVEGNRRLAAVKHILAHPEKYADRPGGVPNLQQIPLLIFPEATSEEEGKDLRVFLGVHHLFGYREWPADSKARFLDRQVRSRADLDRAVRELGIKKSEIRRYLVPYRVRRMADDLWRPYQDQDFWVLGESLMRTGIRNYIELDVDNASLKVRDFNRRKLKNLLAFIYGDGAEKTVTETRHMSTLAKVLTSRQAAAELEKGSTLEEAALLVETREESIHTLERMVAQLRILLNKVLRKHSKVHSLRPLLLAFERFAGAAKAFIRDARSNL